MISALPLNPRQLVCNLTVLRERELRIPAENLLSCFPRILQNGCVCVDIRDLKSEFTALPHAEQFSRPSEFQIPSRDLESVVGLRQDLQPAADRLTVDPVNEYAVGLRISASDPAGKPFS